MSGASRAWPWLDPLAGPIFPGSYRLSATQANISRALRFLPYTQNSGSVFTSYFLSLLPHSFDTGILADACVPHMNLVYDVLTIVARREFPVAQWLENPSGARKVMSLVSLDDFRRSPRSAYKIVDIWHVRYRRLNSPAFAWCARSRDFLRSSLQIASKVKHSGDFSK